MSASAVAVGRALPASSKSFLDSRPVLASSTGPKTLDRSFALLDFFTLDLKPLAILEILICNGSEWLKSERPMSASNAS